MVWVGLSALIFLGLFAAVYWPSQEVRSKRRDAGYSSWQTMLPTLWWGGGVGGSGLDGGGLDGGGFDGGGFDGGGDGGGGGE